MGVFALLIALLSGLGFFVLQQGLVILVILFLLTLSTRFKESTRDFGKYVEILFVFYLIAFLINDLGISYPYSLIIILTGLVVLIFYEGPEWGRLYFGPGATRRFIRQALIIGAGLITVFALVLSLRVFEVNNPVPTEWPFDALIVVGIGFAFYKAVVEEIIFRSFIYQRLQAAAGERMALPIQSAFYGLMHYRTGTPHGIEGIVLGSLLGLALGYLVYASKSIYLSMLVQFVVTLGIFVTLAIIG